VLPPSTISWAAGQPVVASVERILDDLIEIDPSGEAFHLPTARNGSHFLEDTSLINVRIFAVAICTVDDAFDYWHMHAEDTWMEMSSC